MKAHRWLNRTGQRANRQGKRIPTFKFLGFICYWGKARKGFWRLKFKSRRDRFTTKLKGLREYLWKHLNTCKPAEVLRAVMRVIKGWLNYRNISDNAHMVEAFRQQCARTIFKWFNCRGGRRKLNWNRFNRMLKGMGFPRPGKVTSMFCKH